MGQREKMTELPTTQPDACQIIVSPDQMKVLLTIGQGAEVSASVVIAKLREMNVVRFDDGLIIEALEKRKGAAMSIEVAAGTAAVDDRPEVLEYRVPVSGGSSGLSTKVRAGQIIAKITPAFTGTDGCDVFGKPVERRKNESPLQIGRNLRMGKDRIVCQSAGNLRLSGQTLSVEPLLEFRCDNGSITPIQFDGDAIIKGYLNEGRNVQITGSLSVGGAAEAVQLKTGGSFIVQGGIIGKQKGRYIVGGDLRCRFISGGFILVGNDVHVQSDITESRIACGGHLTVAQGVIFGGAIAANGGISCITLGHPGGTPTLIEAGEGIANRSFLLSATLQIEANRKRIHSVRTVIDPLLKIMKTLNAQQREKVTELLYEVDELKAATNKMVADLESQTRSMSDTAKAQVMVESLVHPGVTVSFQRIKTTFNASIRGPFTIEPYKLGSNTEIMLISKADQSRTRLPSQPFDLVGEAKQFSSVGATAA